jgi:peptidoglycan hydrolase-like protein with peptidoglycan-binding domain
VRFPAQFVGISRQSALVYGLFLAVSAGIVANALFLQPRQHPASLLPSEEEPRRLDLPDALVLSVQAALKEAGYYEGPLDGMLGPQTESAILKFEADAGRARTGEVTADFLAAIRSTAPPDTETTSGFEPAATATSAPQVTAELPLSDSRVAAVQAALSRSAYGPLRADGVFGPQTRDAIIRFQQDRGLAITGEISDSLIIELRALGALESDR